MRNRTEFKGVKVKISKLVSLGGLEFTTQNFLLKIQCDSNYLVLFSSAHEFGLTETKNNSNKNPFHARM